MDKFDTREMISALMDGQLHGEELERAVQAASDTAEGRESWQAYHLIGDALRSADLLAGRPAGPLVERLRDSLRHEAPLAAPVDAVAPVHGAAANDSAFRWKLVAGVASVAAVAAVSWSLVAGTGGTRGQPELARADAPALASVAGDRQVMIRDSRLDELLAAHRQMGTSALQAPAGFLRNATFEGPAR